MPKAAPDYTLDGTLERIAEANRLYVCSDEPANFAAIAAVALADVELTPGAGNGDFVIGNGDVSGRKITIAQQADIPITATGEADHVVLADTINSRLLYVTTCTPQSLTQGGTVTVPAWSVEISDPQ
jgi:hypothetical protein